MLSSTAGGCSCKHANADRQTWLPYSARQRPSPQRSFVGWGRPESRDLERQGKGVKLQTLYQFTGQRQCQSLAALANSLLSQVPLLQPPPLFDSQHGDCTLSHRDSAQFSMRMLTCALGMLLQCYNASFYLASLSLFRSTARRSLPPRSIASAARPPPMLLPMHITSYIYIYIYTYIHTYIYIYI